MVLLGVGKTPTRGRGRGRGVTFLNKNLKKNTKNIFQKIEIKYKID